MKSSKVSLLFKSQISLLFLIGNLKAIQATQTANKQDKDANYRNFFTEYLLTEQKHLQMQKLDPLTTSASQSPSSLIVPTSEIFCTLNNDCIDTTYCCSDYSCVHPSKCLHG